MRPVGHARRTQISQETQPFHRNSFRYFPAGAPLSCRRFLHAAMPDYLSYSGHVYYSQSGQEAAVLSLLERNTNGFFIDIAANEPFQNSNTALLERHYGWRGVCIDAAKRSRRRFTETNRTCTFMLALTGDPTSETKSLLFREIVPPPNASPSTAWMHGLSSVVSSTAAPTCWGRHCLTVQEFTRRGVKLMHRSMTPRSLEDILDEAKAPPTIDYMSLDVIPLAELSNQCPSSTAPERPKLPLPLACGQVEGHETNVLRGLHRKVRVLTVERPDAAARTILHQRDMVHACDFDFGEELWIEHSQASSLVPRGINATMLCADGQKTKKKMERQKN